MTPPSPPPPRDHCGSNFQNTPWMPLLTTSGPPLWAKSLLPGPQPHPHCRPPPPLCSPQSSRREPLKGQCFFCDMNYKGSSCTVLLTALWWVFVTFKRKSKTPRPRGPAQSGPMTPLAFGLTLPLPCSLSSSHTSLLTLCKQAKPFPTERPSHSHPRAHSRCSINVGRIEDRETET